MQWFAPFLWLSLLTSTAGHSDPVPHHHDLCLSALAENTEGASELFKSYRSDGPVRWNQAWPWKLDMTGVAWDQPNTATVITPRHVVMAAHYIRGAGMPIIFHDRSGKPHARLVRQVVKLSDRGIQCDVAVGLLDEPLPDSIRRYPLPAVREDDGITIIGATVLVTDQNRRLYFHRVTYIQSNWLGMRFDEEFPVERRKSLVKGDSGHPSFILSNGELVLVSTHTISGAGAGPYYGASVIQEKLREIVRELDPEHTFRTIGFDPPTLADAEAGRRAVSPPPPRPIPQPATRKDHQGKPSPQPPSSPEQSRRQRPRILPPPIGDL